MNRKTKQRNLLPLAAAVVALAAAAITLVPGNTGGETPAEPPPVQNTAAASSDLLISPEKIGRDASYFDYDTNGVTVQVLAVEASDGTVRLALNTCQVCNGSPYAYFQQEGDWFICQNCGNRFASTEVGVVSGGCNPIPITDQIYTEQDGILSVPAAFLEESAALFQNWKRF